MQLLTRPLALSLLLTSSALLPSWAQDVPDRMTPIYKSLKLTPCELGAKGPFTPGDVVTVKCGLKNISGRVLAIPVYAGAPRPDHLLGGYQFWLERLGADAEIPARDRGRDGNRYGAGGASIRSDKTMKRGDVISFNIGGKVDTTDFPPGKYRISVDYQALNGQKVLQTEFVEFELKAK